MGTNILDVLFRWRRKRRELEEKAKEEQRNVTEKEKELAKLSEDVIWFKRMMAHNVRMPLAIIVGYGELLQSGCFATREEELNCIRKICNNIDYIDTITKVLLDNEQENLLEEQKYFDILDCIQRVSECVKTITQKEGINVSVNSSKKEVLFYGNRILMMRAFYNMVENSIRYMNRPGNIFITVEETEKEVLIVYRDDGEGMDEEEAKHITELHYRGSNEKGKGSGMGMYLVQQAISGQGGTLNIKTGQGEGMRIYISFPKVK